MQQKLVAVEMERMMSKEEAEAVDARIVGHTDDWYRTGDNLSVSPSIGAV